MTVNSSNSAIFVFGILDELFSKIALLTMASILFVMLVNVLFYKHVHGEDYCSRTPSRPTCVPCSQLCHITEEQCNVTFYNCPKQCGESIKSTDCSEACNDKCRDGRCEYINTHLRCIGCKPKFTGKVCKEYCIPPCNECHQDNSTLCTTCIGNYTPPHCSTSLDVTLAQATPEDSTPSVNTFNCSLDCKSCNATSGECSVCYIGNYGYSCQHSCSHCIESLCNGNKSCFNCILNYTSSGMICTTGLTPNYKDICTDGDCGQTLGTDKYLKLIAVPVGVTVLVIIIIIVICARRRKTEKMTRDEDPVDDHQDPTPQIEFEVSSEDSGPYTFIRVVDRDCVPDHIYQAAMVTAPFIEPTYLSDHILQTL